MELKIVNIQYDFMRLYLFKVSAQRKLDQQKLFKQMIITTEKVASRIRSSVQSNHREQTNTKLCLNENSNS